MRKTFFFLAGFGLAFCLSFMGIAHGADATIAEVLAVVPGASVIRDGKTEELRQHSALRVSDTVRTDATGRVRILFADDSTVDLGANSRLDLRDFADSGAASVFNVHLLQGVGRVITGKIVEQNPRGFAVSTPEGTIGIRGTIISVRTGDGTTTVYVENTTREVYVNGINVPGGRKITIPDDPVRIEPILPQDRRNLGRDLAFRGGTGVAAAAPEPIMDSARPEEELRGSTQLAGQAGLIPPDTPLAEISLPTQSLGDSLLAGLGGGVGSGGGGGGGGGLIASVTGGVGALTSTTYPLPGAFETTSFGFDVDLATGIISGAYLNGSGMANSTISGTQNLDVAVTGGTGFALSTHFEIDAGFTGSVNWNYTPVSVSIHISGGDTLTQLNSYPTNTTLTGIGYTVWENQSLLQEYDSGIGTGLLTK